MKTTALPSLLFLLAVFVLPTCFLLGCGSFSEDEFLEDPSSLPPLTGVTIISPNEGEEFIFTEDLNTTNAAAVADDPEFTDQLLWRIFHGKNWEFVDVGESMTFHYHGLYFYNYNWGNHIIEASYEDDAGDIRGGRVTVQVYYQKETTDNPEGENPNWFFYWKQVKPENTTDPAVYNSASEGPTGNHAAHHTDLVSN